MGDQLESFLKGHQLSEFYPKLKAEGITYELLPELLQDKDLLNDIFVLGGPRLKFCKAVRNLPVQVSNGVSESRCTLTLPSSTSSASCISSEILSVEPKYIPKTSVGQISSSADISNETVAKIDSSNSNPSQQTGVIRSAANQHPDGLALVGLFDISGTFENSSRIKFANVVIRHQFGFGTNINPETQLSPADLTRLSLLIAEEFPGENALTWYTPSHTPRDGKTTIPKGKLYDQYTEISKELRKAGKRNCKKRRRESDGSQDSFVERLLRGQPPLPACNLTQDQITDKLNISRTENENWQRVCENWRETVAVRQRDLREAAKGSESDLSNDNYVASFLKQYPALQQTFGYKLLEMDFQILYPKAYNRMFTHWDAFISKLKIQLDIEKISYANVKSEAEYFHLLAKLLPSVPVKNPKRKLWKPSRPDMLDGFLLHLKDITDLPGAYQKITHRNLDKGVRVQPFPLVVGETLQSENLESYLVINGKTYKMHSPKHAMQTAFYVYHALYTSYPLQSARLWVILERALFSGSPILLIISQKKLPISLLLED